MIYQGAARYPVTEVILHTSATAPDWWHDKTAQQMHDEIDEWHKARGWKGFGYHLLVPPDGSSVKGRGLTEIGAHVRERNRGTIGICMVNVKSHDAGMKTFDYYFTGQQRQTVRKAIAELHAEGVERVSGHNDWTDAKTCPGFKVHAEDWLPEPPNWLQRMWRRWT